MNYKKNIILFLSLILIIFSGKSQQLVPTETKALMEIYVTDFSDKPLAKETIIFVGTNNKSKISATTDNSGKVKILLPEGDVYDVKYRDFTEQINYSKVEIPAELGAFTYQLNIKFEPGKVYTLKNVNFETSKANLTPNSYTALNDLVGALKDNPAMTIEIAGHTDNIGTDETNLILSQDRANAVMKYLVTKGISQTRLTAKGYGASQPIASNDTEEGRKQNRRTEVRIIKQ